MRSNTWILALLAVGATTMAGCGGRTAGGNGVVWGNLCDGYLSTCPEGETVFARQDSEVVALTMQMLGSPARTGKAQTEEESFPSEEPISIPDDDIPF